MKWGILIVILIVAGAAYYFWTESYFETRGERQRVQVQEEDRMKTRMSEEDPPKVIPEGAIMEDGTIN